MMLRRYLLAINDLTTEHPHKLPDLFFKELLRFLSAKTANFSGLCDHLSTCNFMFSCDLHNISRCEAAYYTTLLPVVNSFLKKLSVWRCLPSPLSGGLFRWNQPLFTVSGGRIIGTYSKASTLCVKINFRRQFSPGQSGAFPLEPPPPRLAAEPCFYLPPAHHRGVLPPA